MILFKGEKSILDEFGKSEDQVDILLTKEWGLSISERCGRLSGSEVVDELAKKLQARYHFAFSDEINFYELEPFKWERERLSRFLNIPKYGSGKKWAYAFNMPIGDNELKDEPEPPNLIANPYNSVVTNSNKRPLETETENSFDGDKQVLANREKNENKKFERFCRQVVISAFQIQTSRII